MLTSQLALFFGALLLLEIIKYWRRYLKKYKGGPFGSAVGRIPEKERPRKNISSGMKERPLFSNAVYFGISEKIGDRKLS